MFTHNFIFCSDPDAAQEVQIKFVDEIFRIESRDSPRENGTCDEGEGEARMKKPDCDRCKVCVRVSLCVCACVQPSIFPHCRTIHVASASTVHVVCVEGRRTRTSKSCVTSVTRPTTSGASPPHLRLSQILMNGESYEQHTLPLIGRCLGCLYQLANGCLV